MGALNPTISSIPNANAKSQGVGALASLESSPYDFSSTRYPLSVGTDDAPHYMVFNINLPEGSKYIDTAGGAVANVQSSSQNNYDLKQSIGGSNKISPLAAVGGGTAAGLGSAVLNGGSTSKALEGVQSGAIAVLANSIELRPKLQRVKKSIAIYMPDTVSFETNQTWDAINLTDAIGAAGSDAALGQGIKNIGGNLIDEVGNAVKYGDTSYFNQTIYNNAQGAEAIGRAGEAIGAKSGFTELALRSVNRAINPQVEMVFKGTPNREFVFEFDFQPRSSSESRDILDIVNTFRRYAAPELPPKESGSGRYFVPPAQFDISFFFKDIQNDKIPRISTCALLHIAVNYSASGAYATFPDGMPVHIKMVLTFREMDIITRELIDNGY